MSVKIDDTDIVFVTTTFFSKWLDYQKRCIQRMFPKSEFITIDGTKNWPNAWFYWLEKLKNRREKWFVHIDEDCFLTNREELEKVIHTMKAQKLTLSAVSDAFHHFRGANSVAMNSFFMVGNTRDLNELNFSQENLNFWIEESGWKNNLNIVYDQKKHGNNHNYPHEKMENGENLNYEQEPYYILFWMLKEAGRNFNYLFPHFDDRFMSTNPRISKDSPDIAIHMWYVRTWESPSLIHGVPNFVRYNRIQEHLNKVVLR